MLAPAPPISLPFPCKPRTPSPCAASPLPPPPGVVCDYGLTLSDLIGVLQQFFDRLGLRKLRFKPAFNPYTEPSMEIFSYSEQLDKWIEVGGLSFLWVWLAGWVGGWVGGWFA